MHCDQPSGRAEYERARDVDGAPVLEVREPVRDHAFVMAQHDGPMLLPSSCAYLVPTGATEARFCGRPPGEHEMSGDEMGARILAGAPPATLADLRGLEKRLKKHVFGEIAAAGSVILERVARVERRLGIPKPDPAGCARAAEETPDVLGEGTYRSGYEFWEQSRPVQHEIESDDNPRVKRERFLRKLSVKRGAEIDASVKAYEGERREFMAQQRRAIETGLRRANEALDEAIMARGKESELHTVGVAQERREEDLCRCGHDRSWHASSMAAVLSRTTGCVVEIVRGGQMCACRAFKSATERPAEVAPTGTQLVGRIRELEEQLERAWGVIANAGDGDWTRESDDWQKAAHEWGVANKFRYVDADKR